MDGKPQKAVIFDFDGTLAMTMEDNFKAWQSAMSEYGIKIKPEDYYECDPLNLGSGIPTSIRQIVETLLKHTPQKPKVVWDTSRPTGNQVRLMDMSKTRKKLNFKPEYSLDQGIRETVEWYLANKNFQAKKQSLFV